jgi:hypothetical protein
MLNTDTELLFPMRVIPFLVDLRGEDFQELVRSLSNGERTQNEIIAFSLMMVRMAGCGGCNADSFRAMRGCTQCARLTVKRNKNNDKDLLKSFTECKKEIDEYMTKREILLTSD